MSGKNVIETAKKKSGIIIFLEQFKDLLVAILVVAAIVSAISGSVDSTVVIIVVLIMNAIIGTIEQVKANKSLESLKKLSPTKAKVLRNGVLEEINSEDVEVGDILVLEAGDMVVADGDIIDNGFLQVNESSLTGETTAVDKTDRVYSSSLVTFGRANVKVTEIGMDTEIGKIAKLMKDAGERKTPLQISLDNFSKKLAMLITIISIVVFGIYVIRGERIIDALMLAVALAVAAIPEALGSIVTIVQAIGTQKMASENAIIRKLKAVESLGCVSVICTDKTGTLTQNKMTVQKIYIDGKVIEPKDIELDNKLHRYLLYDAILSNNSVITEDKKIGDPTEYALLDMLREIDGEVKVDENVVRDTVEKIDEIPFSSERKMMSVQCKLSDETVLLTKGAPDILLDRCKYIRTKDGISELKNKGEIYKANEEFANSGERVLAFAYKPTDKKLSENSENDMIFLGLIAMIDPPREETIKAVADAKMAGIKTVMITGDHILTAKAIAKKIGIYKEGDNALTREDIDNMSDEELENVVEDTTVYARVSPENKIRVVKAWQSKGHITAMTGDGVNDGPALKRADIGVAMGITGTEVAKEAGDMILADDNFATIIKAVANGRNVYRNIKNAILFLLSGNMAGIMVVLITSLLGLPIPFTAVHLLFMNLLTDSLPAIAIGLERADSSLLMEKPRSSKQNILSKDFITNVLAQGGLIAITTLVAYSVGLSTNSMFATTFAFETLTIARLFHGFNCRGKFSIFKLKLNTNMYSIGAFVLGILFIALVSFLSIGRRLFEIAPLNKENFMLIILFAIIPSVIIQTCRLIKEHKK
ncbi:cation-translocating P-type ATPase [uncultured Eubacterium sp.]|uniref:cation-translocating P-type ATPase n=1 Tax=Eubacterium sp. TaxID=142586 RepID=UPI002672A37B|nr:cation-translocating P-type ATPase [uncultured Eubacterium sp.]